MMQHKGRRMNFFAKLQKDMDVPCGGGNAGKSRIERGIASGHIWIISLNTSIN